MKMIQKIINLIIIISMLIFTQSLKRSEINEYLKYLNRELQKRSLVKLAIKFDKVNGFRLFAMRKLQKFLIFVYLYLFLRAHQ